MIDDNTGKSLAFVNISFNDSGKGTTSNIDGSFQISSSFQIYRLLFSYVGYKPVTLDILPNEKRTRLLIRLIPRSYSIREVEIAPGINPAHRIIDLVNQNRKYNDPEKMRSFSYTSYNKLYLTVEIGESQSDSLFITPTPAISDTDTSLSEIKELTDKQHLFLIESVSNREFTYPDNNYEEVVATRVSGLQDPSFALLATQIQSFSFYKNFITLFDKNYLNPISTGSKNKYLFILEDTLFTESEDTLFIITYQPKKGKNFDGLKGFMYVNSNRYAIQNVIAEAADPEDMFRINIQQKYEFIDNRQWFPVQLNTDIIFSNPPIPAKPKNLSLVGIGKSYISDINLEPDLNQHEKKEFGLKINKKAHKQPENIWNQYRYEPLTKKDTTTYHIIDSIGRKVHLDEKLWALETLMNGYIPFYFLNIDIASIIDYNKYEGLRIGIGGITNEKLFDKLFFGGHFAYGFGDKVFKYGGRIKWVISKPLEMDLQIKYLNDVQESASYRFIETKRKISTEYFRKYLVEQMDMVEGWDISYGFKALQYFYMRPFITQSHIIYGNEYLFRIPGSQPELYSNRGDFTEVGIRFRFAYKEKFIESARRKISLGSRYPVLHGNIIKGVNWFNGQFVYTKLEARITTSLTSRIFGKSQFSIIGGLVIETVPYTKLYNGRGSYKTFTIETANSFGTMRMNEFLSDRFISLFFRQDFGKLLIKINKFQPNIVLLTNFGIGSLSNAEYHRNIEYKTLEKGYYESGFLINNILNQFFIGYGLGLYYRYGPNSLEKTIDNFAFKFTINFRL